MLNHGQRSVMAQDYVAGGNLQSPALQPNDADDVDNFSWPCRCRQSCLLAFKSQCNIIESFKKK